jgi:hypothetical protein
MFPDQGNGFRFQPDPARRRGFPVNNGFPADVHHPRFPAV